MRLFAPLLAGANLRDRFIACLGALIGIALVGVTYAEFAPFAAPIYAAPIGASAVLLFAVPSSPLAQPWSVIGGNTLSMGVGLAVLQIVPDPIGGAAIAVSAAILVMSLLRCLHPPGGAVALSAVLAGPMQTAAQCTAFGLTVAVNSALLVLIGWFFHRYSGHSYPHRAVPVMWKDVAPTPPVRVTLEDIDKALDDLGETFDVAREDLALLLARAEIHAAERTGPA
ncbi:HPP family protein [Sphingomonas cavernae]|uniref:HPP family protein n=1 Tax=Sphingomonas cavernae TaxID=2320861 RepID=A0A418W8B1_9SPHN|nr:HPP family protein [Sphingomonas cavernae]